MTPTPLANLLKGGAGCPDPYRSKPGSPRGCRNTLTMSASPAAAQRSVHAFSARPLAGGEPVSLGSLRGKVLLIENVASL